MPLTKARNFDTAIIVTLHQKAYTRKTRLSENIDKAFRLEYQKRFKKIEAAKAFCGSKKFRIIENEQPIYIDYKQAQEMLDSFDITPSQKAELIICSLRKSVIDDEIIKNCASRFDIIL